MNDHKRPSEKPRSRAVQDPSVEIIDPERVEVLPPIDTEAAIKEAARRLQDKLQDDIIAQVLGVRIYPRRDVTISPGGMVFVIDTEQGQ